MALSPWREIVTPHPDIATGRYHQAEFAANLGEVIAGKADAEYQDPIEFFARTYLTVGMQRLLATAVKQVTGKDEEPIVQLKTAFGGGKTHSMLALYHLLSGKASLDQMEGAEEILKQAEVTELPTVRFAVIVGTALNPSRPQDINGIKTRTLWGNIAAQLGGKEGYAIVQTADKKSVAPGANDLTMLLNEFGPAIILIDELVAYARNIYNVRGLPAGSFDANLTFVQSLTEAVENAERSQLVASIPESDIEIGGEAGQAALERIQHTIGRLEGIWRPVDADEGFEIVRRRLFSPVKDQTAHDTVCRAFTQLYDENPAEFPVECREASYLDRLRRAYPIHPELFDRLYDDWAPLDNFQKTRGVLRLMAAVIHYLWVNEDRASLILPGSIPLDSPRVREELLRYLPESWNAVVDKDVDGARSEPRAIDASLPRFGEISAAQRVARTIFMGSAPHGSGQTVRGLEEMRIRLGVVQPDEQVAVFNDATKRLTERLTHLYTRAQRYWYDTHPNLRRTMEDRAAKLEPDIVEREIVRRLRQQTQRGRGDFTAVHPCPLSADVPDESTARLVILSPTTGHQARAQESGALATALNILDKRGDIPRTYRNMLIFVASDTGEWEPLERETRRYLAWDSIVQEVEALNLDANQRREAALGKKQSDETVGMRLNEAYSWLLVPTQEGTDPIKWEAIRISGADDNPVAKAVAKVRNDQQLLPEWSPVLLKMELDNWLWKDESHISLKRVWECLATYLYLSRLRDSDVLLDTVREGIKTKAFGYANSVDDTGQYNGLQFGSTDGSIYLEEPSVLVKPDIAAKQLEADESVYPQPPSSDSEVIEGGSTDSTSGGQTESTGTEAVSPQAAAPKRFYGTVNLDPIRPGRDAQRVIEEVLQHLTSLPGTDVKITMDIEAKVSDGVPEDVVRTVTENCRTLQFTTQEFEEE